MEHKTCGKCKAQKLRSEFTKNSGTKDGLCNRCRPCALAEVNAYAERNKEKNAQRRAARYAANKELFAKRSAAIHAKYAPQRRADMRDYYAAHREGLVAAKRSHRAAKPESVRAATAKSRAKRVAAPGSHTAADIKALMRLQRGLCVGCRCDIRGAFHVDHIQALARGGSNDRLNLQLLCPTCNVSKNARDPIEFMQSRGFLL